jgi:hypothetical protein
MTDSTPTKKPLNRNAMYLIVGLFAIVVLLVWNWERYLAAAMIIGAIAYVGYRVLPNRSALGRYRISTVCDGCGAMLQQHMGVPETVCRSCGKRQSWSK